MIDEPGKHYVAGFGFSLEVSKNAGLRSRANGFDDDGLLLAEPPATANGLVELFVGVVREVGHVRAVLPVHPKGCDFWLRDQHANLAMAKRTENLFFAFVRV